MHCSCKQGTADAHGGHASTTTVVSCYFCCSPAFSTASPITNKHSMLARGPPVGTAAVAVEGVGAAVSALTG